MTKKKTTYFDIDEAMIAIQSKRKKKVSKTNIVEELKKEGISITTATLRNSGIKLIDTFTALKAISKKAGIPLDKLIKHHDENDI